MCRLRLAVAQLLLLGLLPSGAVAGPAVIYTAKEMKKCGGWVSKGPNFAYDGKGRIFVVNACRSKGKRRLEDDVDVEIALSLNHTNTSRQDRGRRLDPVGGQVIVIKSSSDGGKTWGGFKVISGAHSGYSGGKCIYDTKRKQLVVQFFRFPSGESSKTAGGVLYQVISKDGGKSWSGKRNITSILKPCFRNGNPPTGVAGSRIQTPSGRLLFGGFGFTGSRCIWYSDDGGNSYKCTGLQQPRTNEWSVAIAGKSGQLILNSRASGAKFSPYRPTYFSKDNGVSWGSAKNSKWKDSINKNKHGCEGSLLGIGKAVFYFNPTGQGKKARTKMEVRCSLDGGRTLSGEAYAVTSTSKGGYSQMAPTGSKKTPLLIGWGDTTNVFVEQINTKWCH